MIYRSTRKEIENYYAHNAINQSALKELINNGIEAFVDKYQLLVSQSDLYYEEKAFYIIGKGVDCRLTEGEEEFKNQFHISKLIKKPGEKVMSIIKDVFDDISSRYTLQTILVLELAQYKKEIYNSCDNHAYYMNRRKESFEEDGRVLTIVKDGGLYWEDLKLAAGKQILSDDEANTILAVTNSLLTHPHTASLFQDGSDIDIIYQFPVFFTINGVECKGLIDKIIINHTTKQIIPCDIKTIGDYISNFKRKIKSLRYDIQGSFYDYGLKLNKNNINKLIHRDISEYRIAKFAFIVESTIKQGCPLVFVLTDKLLEQGRYGDITEKGNLRFGWQHGLDEYQIWSENYAFKIERKVESTNGVVFVDEHYEYVNL